MYSKGENFTNFPREILLGIYSYLSPTDIYFVSLVNIRSRQIATGNMLWVLKFIQHFPHLSDENELRMKSENEQYWYDKYRQAHQNDYHTCPGFFFKNKIIIERNKKLFPLFKEGDLQGLKITGLQLEELDYHDINRISLLKWAKIKKFQHLLDYCFDLAVLKYSSKHRNMFTFIDVHDRTILHWAILCHQDIDIVMQLVTGGCPVNVTDALGKTFLHYAAQEGSEACISFLITLGVAINAQDTYGSTPLLLAVENNHKKAVESLLLQNSETYLAEYRKYEYGTRPGVAPLHAAVKRGYTDIVIALLDYGADANLPSWVFYTHHYYELETYTPLHFAAKSGNAQIAKLLIEKGADVNARSRSTGITPLMLAIRHNHRAVIDVLIFHKADISMACGLEGGSSPLHVAVKFGFIDIVEILLNNGADINAITELHSTPLYLSEKYGHEEISKLLTSQGAIINTKDIFGKLYVHSLSFLRNITFSGNNPISTVQDDNILEKSFLNA